MAAVRPPDNILSRMLAIMNTVKAVQPSFRAESIFAARDNTMGGWVLFFISDHKIDFNQSPWPEYVGPLANNGNRDEFIAPIVEDTGGKQYVIGTWNGYQLM